MSRLTRNRGLEMKALAEAGVTLTSELNLDAVLQKIVDVACELVGARYGALSVVGLDAQIDEFVFTGISPAERELIGPLPRGRGLLGVILREGASLRLEDMATDPRSAGFPAHHPPMKSLLGVPVVFRDRVIGNLYLTDKQDGSAFTEEDEEIVRLLAAQAAVAIRNAELYESQVRHTTEWKSLFEMGREVTASPDLQHLLDSAVSRARRLLETDIAVLMMLRGEDSLVVASQEGLRGPPSTEPHPLDEYAPQRLALETDSPVIVSDLASDERLRGHPAALVTQEALASLICVPLRGAKGILGALTVGNRRPTTFDERQAELLEAFANWAAVAIETSRLHDMLESVARLEERERIGMDLHDGVIQSIYAVGLHLEDCVERIEESPQDVKLALERAMDDLNHVIGDIRSYIFDLRPKVSQVADLPDAIRQLVEDVRVNTLMDARVLISEPFGGLIDEDQALALFHIAQEALNNVAKHSRASTVRVSLIADSGRVCLEVTDNGIGFRMDETQASPGQGLRNITDRARSVGADLAFESEPGRGAKIRVELPGR